jgi:hypothetical protein
MVSGFSSVVKVLSGGLLVLGLALPAIASPKTASACVPCPKGYYCHDALNECRPINPRFEMPKAIAPTPEAWCRYRGQTNCSVLDSGSGGVVQGDDPDMGDREGTPPSVGAGTRAKHRGSGRAGDKPPDFVGQSKGLGMWQVCISTPQNPNGNCYGEMSRAEAEAIAKSHMDDPDLEPGVKVWAQEID